MTACVAAHRAEPERLGRVAEHTALVVEAVEVVRQPDRVRRKQLGAAACDRLPHRRRAVGEALDQLLLLGASAPGGSPPTGAPSAFRRIAGDARVRVLHVVDGVLLRLLGRQVEVDVDRLVRAAVDEVPARGVDADLVHEVVEEDDVAAALRHLGLLAAARQVHGLVEQHLDARRVVAEHACDRRVPLAVPWWSAPST